MARERRCWHMDEVTIAVVDAAQRDREDAGGGQPRSRYLTPIANSPLIAHVLDGLAGAGIEQVLILVPRQAHGEFESVLGAGDAWGVNLSYLEKEPGAGCGGVISQLRDAAGGGPVLVHSGDCLFPGQVPRLRSRFHAGDLDLALLVSLPAEASGERSNQVRLPRERPHGTALILGPSVWPVLETLSCERLSARALLESLDGAGCRAALCGVGEHWCYSDSAEQLLIANRMLLDTLPECCPPASLGNDSTVHGRVVVSPTARVSDSTIRGPALIGDCAVVESSFIGPHTAIGPEATVVGADIDYTMVLAGAEVRYPGYRLEASVIGERAVVSRAFSLPKALHLRVGPEARVVLS